MLSAFGPTVIGYWEYPEEDCTSVVCLDCGDAIADADEDTGAAVRDDHDAARQMRCARCGRGLMDVAAARAA